MSWTFLASAKGNGASSAAATLNTTNAKLIVVEAAFSGAASIADSAGNTWQAGTLFNSTTPNVRFWYCISPTTSATHTVTVTGAVSAIVVSAWNATNTPVLDSQSIPNTANSTQGRVGASTFTPTVNGCLILAGASWTDPTSGFNAGAGWTLIDAQPYVGGTSFGTSCAYKTQTTATAIPTSEGTVTWTSGAANHVFNGIAFAETVSAGLTIDTPKAFEVHQRSGTTGSIQISGTVSGAAEDIEASFNGGAYVTIATSVAAGSFTGTLTGQAQGQGTLTVRKKVTTSASASVANVGIGDVFLFGGDSRSEGRGTNGQAYSHATLKAAKFTGGAWAELTESAGAGTMAPLLATQIMASQNVPVAFIYTGAGGTDVSGANNTWAKPGAQYTAAVNAVTNSTVSGVKAAIFLLGPNAIYNANGAAIPLATYRTAIDTLASNLATDLPGAPKLFVDICGEMSSALPPDPTTARNNIRGAILSAWTNNSSAVKPGPVLIDQDYADNVHPSTDAQLLQMAVRMWPSLAEAFYSGSVGSGRGPRINTVAWNSSRNQITVTFSRALKTGLTHSTQCWTVLDNGTPLTVSSIAYHGTNPAALLINLSAAASGPAGTSTISFANSDDAVGRVIPLSTDVTLPSGTTNLPAEPVYAMTVAEFDATAPILSSPTGTSTGSTSANGSVVTNEGNGTLYYLASTSPSVSVSTIKSTGTTSVVTATGTQNASFTGLLASTLYYAHYVHTDAAGNDSTVAVSSGFTTSAAPPPSSNSAGGLPRIGLLGTGQLIVLFP